MTEGERVKVTLSNGETGTGTFIGAGFVLCDNAMARSHGHCVGRATDPFWVKCEPLP